MGLGTKSSFARLLRPGHPEKRHAGAGIGLAAALVNSILIA
jgi:hypothetical protein